MVYMLVVNERIRIPDDELKFTYERSRGPGGQNVNKVNTKAALRWNLAQSAALADDVRARFMEKFHRRITTGGELVLASDRFRYRVRNVEDCLDKLRLMILEVATAPRPRRPTRPTRSSVQRRLKEKAARGEKKGRRRLRPPAQDD
jgi:ribosome-associated protein